MAEGILYKPTVDKKKCSGCELCRLMCPDLCITVKNGTKEIEIDYYFCKACAICEAVCPKKAIKMELSK